MAFSKAKQFNPTTFHQSSWAKALAHPARIIILRHLSENGSTSFQILWRKLPLSKSTVSQHLKILREAHLIEAREEFPNTFYNLNRNNCKKLATQFNEVQQVFSN